MNPFLSLRHYSYTSQVRCAKTGYLMTKPFEMNNPMPGQFDQTSDVGRAHFTQVANLTILTISFGQSTFPTGPDWAPGQHCGNLRKTRVPYDAYIVKLLKPVIKPKGEKAAAAAGAPAKGGGGEGGGKPGKEKKEKPGECRANTDTNISLLLSR